MSEKSIFQVLSDYHRSLDTMKDWLEEIPLEEAERIGIVDAWQQEMKDYFEANGFCFACNRTIPRCRCEEPL